MTHTMPTRYPFVRNPQSARTCIPTPQIEAQLSRNIISAFIIIVIPLGRWSTQASSLSRRALDFTSPLHYGRQPNCKGPDLQYAGANASSCLPSVIGYLINLFGCDLSCCSPFSSHQLFLTLFRHHSHVHALHLEVCHLSHIPHQNRQIHQAHAMSLQSESWKTSAMLLRLSHRKRSDRESLYNAETSALRLLATMDNILVKLVRNVKQ